MKATKGADKTVSVGFKADGVGEQVAQRAAAALAASEMAAVNWSLSSGIGEHLFVRSTGMALANDHR